jgi:hypothetical protein
LSRNFTLSRGLKGITRLFSVRVSHTFERKQIGSAGLFEAIRWCEGAQRPAGPYDGATAIRREDTRRGIILSDAEKSTATTVWGGEKTRGHARGSRPHSIFIFHEGRNIQDVQSLFLVACKLRRKRGNFHPDRGARVYVRVSVGLAPSRSIPEALLRRGPHDHQSEKSESVVNAKRGLRGRRRRRSRQESLPTA